MKPLNPDYQEVYGYIAVHNDGVHIKILLDHFRGRYQSKWIYQALQQLRKRGAIAFHGKRGWEGGTWKKVDRKIEA